MPKRKHEEAVSSDAEEPDNANSGNSNDEPEKKRARKSVNFEDVHVFYFNRTQGFVCVPSQGGTTLGMSDKHQSKEVYKLSDYSRRRKILHQKRRNREGSSFNFPSESAVHDEAQEVDDASLDAGRQEDENMCISERLDSKVDEEDDEEEEISSNASIVPVPARRRRMMLRLSGVRKIDAGEKDECQEIRQSREYCGCSCQVFCDPDSCECSKDGIQCQVDRMRFPCGCTREGCGNQAGRIEFNPARVRTHFVHTLMRLELEKQLGETIAATSATSSTRRHIRFNDDGDPTHKSTGEPPFNSNELGTCCECSRPECSDPFGSQPVPASLSAADMPSISGGDGDLQVAVGQPLTMCTENLTAEPTRNSCYNCTGLKSTSGALLWQAVCSKEGVVPAQTGWHATCRGAEASFKPEPACYGTLAVAAAFPLDQPTSSSPVGQRATSHAVSGLASSITDKPSFSGSSCLDPIMDSVMLSATFSSTSSCQNVAAAPWLCHHSNNSTGATLPSKCHAMPLTAEMPCLQDTPLPKAFCQIQPTERAFPAAVADCNRSYVTDNGIVPASAVLSSRASVTCPSDVVGSNHLYLSFQHDEGLYADADPLLANFCHQSAYPPIASSHDSHIAASQELAPFADLIESVYETVSA